MLTIIADLCEACSKERSKLKKIALKERLNDVRYKMIIEAQGRPSEDCEEGENEYFSNYYDLEEFFKEAETNCFACCGKDASIHRMIQERMVEEMSLMKDAEEEIEELEAKSGKDLLRPKVISMERALRKKKMKFLQ